MRHTIVLYQGHMYCLPTDVAVREERYSHLNVFWTELRVEKSNPRLGTKISKSYPGLGTKISKMYPGLGTKISKSYPETKTTNFSWKYKAVTLNPQAIICLFVVCCLCQEHLLVWYQSHHLPH